MINYTIPKSAEKLFCAPAAEAGSNAEKLLNIRKSMQRHKRELRDSERKARENARVDRQPTSGTRRGTT